MCQVNAWARSANQLLPWPEKRREWDSLERRVAAGGGNGHYAVPTVLTGPVIQKICAARLCASMSVDEEDRTEGLVEGDLAEIERFCSLTDKSMRSVLALGKGSPRCPEAADSLLMWSATCGHIVEPTDALFPKLVRDCAAVEKDGLRGWLSNMSGANEFGAPIGKF